MNTAAESIHRRRTPHRSIWSQAPLEFARVVYGLNDRAKARRNMAAKTWRDVRQDYQ